MFRKMFTLLIGMFMCSISMVFFLLYLNLLQMGYSFIDYLQYVFTRGECLILFVGILLICFSLKKGKNNELYL